MNWIVKLRFAVVLGSGLVDVCVCSSLCRWRNDALSRHRNRHLRLEVEDECARGAVLVDRYPLAEEVSWHLLVRDVRCVEGTIRFVALYECQSAHVVPRSLGAHRVLDLEVSNGVVDTHGDARGWRLAELHEKIDEVNASGLSAR